MEKHSPPTPDLSAYELEIEKLKFQLARPRREKYGSSSERIDCEITQLELKFKGFEAATAEAVVKAQAAAPGYHRKPGAGKEREAAP